METFIQILTILIVVIPVLICLVGAFCIMFDTVFGTDLGEWITDNDIIIKGLAVAGMLYIILLPIIIAYSSLNS